VCFGRGKVSRHVRGKTDHPKPMARMKPLTMRRRVTHGSSGATRYNSKPAEPSRNVKQNPLPGRDAITEIT